MALIFCDKCGKQISDKALVCPHCGDEKDPLQSNAACSECGMPIPENVTVCPNCGFPLISLSGTAEKKKKTDFLPIILLSVIGVLAIAFIGVMLHTMRRNSESKEPSFISSENEMPADNMASPVESEQIDIEPVSIFALPSYISYNEYERVNDEIRYDISELSASEIASLCEYYFNNLPFKGQSYEDYKSTLRVSPLEDRVEEYGTCYQYSVHSTLYPTFADSIEAIYIDGISPQMNGTIGFGFEENPYVSIVVSLRIMDYEKATELYSLLFDYCAPHYQFFGQEITDSRETTRWNASGTFPVSSTAGREATFLHMEKQEYYNTKKTFYIIEASYHSSVER